MNDKGNLSFGILSGHGGDRSDFAGLSCFVLPLYVAVNSDLVLGAIRAHVPANSTETEKVWPYWNRICVECQSSYLILLLRFGIRKANVERVDTFSKSNVFGSALVKIFAGFSYPEIHTGIMQLFSTYSLMKS